jgi:acetylornithine deacetylase
MLVPGETTEMAVAQLESLIANLGLESRVIIETPPPVYQPFVMDTGSPAVRAFQGAYLEVHGRPAAMGGLMGIADNNIYVAEGGIPTIAHGPRGKGLHEADEYVEIDSLDPCVDVLVGTARHYGRSAP